MRNPKRKAKRSASEVAKVAGTVVALAPNGDAVALDPTIWLPAAKIRQRLGGISPVTFWRWRHNPKLGFPSGKLVNGRWYFPWSAVAAWHARLPEAAWQFDRGRPAKLESTT
jgi:hypothetical protein